MSGANPKFRRAARIAIVQALYQMDVANAPFKTVVREFRNHRFGYNDESDVVQVDENFFEEVIEGVVGSQNAIDTKISTLLPEKWPLRRLDLTLRSLLRASAFEIMRRPDVPALVIINEYVSIAADFFDGKEPGMVNSILDKIAKEVRASEFGLVGAAPIADTSNESGSS
ncbi:NusB antitermination factor [Litorimonas taeanensis]|uniref:Transcription antitermination protein NusB n=1 Tax=Litorimonas taeanensis TaxID=568099 RepID=A0A420WKG6_9PROT|nr:transcription antitermination factor NusB [Litorimonas taeanensis]RKQ71426.1 NusB antitermination factor [Litorimonas taeanensis]